MTLFSLGLILTFIGVFASIRGNTSRFNPPSGGGSRIPPEAQVRLNESVQRVAGKKETYDSYYKESNSFKPNWFGLITLISGIAIIAVDYLFLSR